MKKYIILGWCGGMGGGNIYTRNQCIIARKMGWEPLVIHFSEKATVIPDLKKYDTNRVLEMRLPPSYYTNRERERIINKFLAIINPQKDDVFFIESNGVRYSYWGELLAKLLGCKHFAFLVEFYFSWNDDYYEFFSFKLKRKELAGIYETSLPSLFGKYREVDASLNKSITAYCTNSVEDIENTICIDYNQYDFIIGNIGRSTKPYVQQVARDLAEYAGQHCDKKILFMIVGGEKGTKEEDSIKSSLYSHNNITLLSTGFLFPIPRVLLSHLDVAIASSGCIRIALEANLPTIAYKDDEKDPYGICGYDITYPLPDKPVNARNLSMILDDILFNDFCKKNKNTQFYEYKDENDSWAQLEQDTEYMLQPTESDYYDTKNIVPRNTLRRLYVCTIGRFFPFHKIVEWLT